MAYILIVCKARALALARMSDLNIDRCLAHAPGMNFNRSLKEMSRIVASTARHAINCRLQSSVDRMPCFCRNYSCISHECVQLSTTLHSWTLLLNCYGQLESREKSLPPTQLFDTNFFSHELRNNETESPLKDVDSVCLATSPSPR